MKKRIGLLFSLTGTISIIGKGQLQGALLGIEEINRSRSVTFDPIIRDAKSNPQIAAQEAYNLYMSSKIDALVGCYMSSTRNSLIPVLNDTKGLLLYPTVYEGEQIHPNIFYLGAVPNQQVEPLLSWTITNISSNFVLVGSDYVYPRSINKQVKSWVQNAGGKICLERYFPLGCTKFGDFFKELLVLRKLNPSLVTFSTLVGGSVVLFYKEYKRNNLSFPIISPITSERELQVMGKEAAAGHYCSSAYFQSIDTELNTKFVKAFHDRFGNDAIGRETASSYEAIHLLSMAYDRISKVPSGNKESEKVRMALKNLSFQGPQGKVIMDPYTQHLWQWSRIGRVKPDGEIEVIWMSPGPIPPKHDIEPMGSSVCSNSSEPESSNAFNPIKGKERLFLECIRMANIASQVPSNVLITGETGTGKELFAKAIHDASPRRNYPFIPINCPALPRELITSELFGYEEGSFTGAKRGGMVGKLELANKGTLFLDEIGEIPVDLQTHLLRFLQERELYRIGGGKTIRLDIRVLSSTNRDLQQEINHGRFREDLYYRLSVFHIHLPPLRDRIDDIPILLNHFLLLLNSANFCKKILAPETLSILMKHSWPGNIREMANVIEQSFYVSLRSEVILPMHLPRYIASNKLNRSKTKENHTASIDLQQEDGYDSLENSAFVLRNSDRQYSETYPMTDKSIFSINDSEERLIKHAIKRSGYNMSKASRLLGISRSTLYRKVKKYYITLIPDRNAHNPVDSFLGPLI